MKKNIFFFFSVFFSHNTFSVDLKLEESVSESSSSVDLECSQLVEVSINALMPVEKIDSKKQFPKFFDELHDQVPLFSCEQNDGSPRSVLVKNFKKQNSNLLRRNMFKNKYDRLFNEKYVDLHFDPMHGGSFNIEINQKSDDDTEEDNNFENDEILPMDHMDYVASLEE